MVAVGADGCWAESTRTCYLTANTLVRIERDGVDIVDACVGAFPPTEGSIALARGDLLMLTRELTPGRTAVSDSAVGPESRDNRMHVAQVFEDASQASGVDR